MQKPEPKTGIARLISACCYSLKGLRSCFKHEEAFRLEVIIVAGLLVALLAMPVPPLLKLLLFFASGLVLIVELLNSAVEAVVDKVSPEFSKLAGRAKDMASAAVFISLVMAGVMWTYALILVFFPG